MFRGAIGALAAVALSLSPLLAGCANDVEAETPKVAYVTAVDLEPYVTEQELQQLRAELLEEVAEAQRAATLASQRAEAIFNESLRK